MQTVCVTLKMLIEFLRSTECRIWLRMALKPLAVLATLALFLWLGAWFDTQIANHIAHAEANEISEMQTLACWSGTEQNGGLCYPLCQAGFTGVGPVCYKNCPAGYKDDGALCRLDAHIFAKASYGRGGGIGLICASNQEAQGGLCFPKCASTHYGVGAVCWQRCPAGYTDDGAFCRRPFPLHIFAKNSYGRGAGGPVTVCSAGMEKNGALCYPKCQAGYYGAGPVCFQTCPAGYKDDGALCRKDAIIFAKESYGRGAGEVLNTIPVAVDETVRTPKDTPAHLRIPFTDANDDATSFILVKDVSNGSFDGNTYTPNAGFEGADVLLWKVTDGKNESNIAASTIIVGNVAPNSAPVAIDRTVAVTEDTTITITVTCTDANNDPLFYQLLAKPQHGDYQWLPPNTVIYTPTVDFVGTDSFTFRSHDGQNSSNVSTITLTVNAANDAPVILTQPISTTRNSNAAVTLAATDVESDTITYTVVSSPTHGSLSGAIPNLLYTPEENFVGEDSFQFRATDAHGAATVATIPITVLPTNTAPLAASLILTTSQGSAVAVNLTGSDADDDALTYTLVSSPTHGALTGEGTDWVYTPEDAFTGVETFTFKSSDGQAESAVATITIHVTAVPAEATLAGLVFDDRNGNGQPDANETGVSGLLITLLPTQAQAATATGAFTTTTDSIGAWRLDGVPFGQYILHIEAANGIQLASPRTIPVTLNQRGVQQGQPAGVQVAGRSLFLTVIVR